MTINNAHALRMRYFLTQNNAKNAKMENEELTNAPPPAPAVWQVVDKIYKWMATDADGVLWVYENKPYLVTGKWWPRVRTKAMILLSCGPPCPTWKESLSKRPEK